MLDLDEDDFEDMDDFDFSWSVYEYRGEYVGISIAISFDEAEIESRSQEIIEAEGKIIAGLEWRPSLHWTTAKPVII